MSVEERHRPRLITPESLAAEAMDRFEKQYAGYDRNRRFVDGKSPHAIIAQLKSLGRTPTPREVADIISESWVRVRCDACRESVSWAVEVGQPADYESATAVLCRECLTEAATLLAAPEVRG